MLFQIVARRACDPPLEPREPEFGERRAQRVEILVSAIHGARHDDLLSAHDKMGCEGS